MGRKAVKELFEVDELQLYFGEDFKLNDYMTIHQPTLGEIVSMGESAYFNLVHTLTATPSDMIAQLDDMKIDWNKIEDFQLFSMLVVTLKPESTRILFGDFDFTKFEIVPIEGSHHVLHHTELDFDFDELRYDAMVRYLRKMHGLKKNVSLAGNEATRRIMIEMAHEDLDAQKRKPYKSQMRSLISTMVNMPGFKYNLQQIREIKLCEFMDSVSRIQVIQSSTALMHGIYSGNVDTKKLNKKELNYMRDIAEK